MFSSGAPARAQQNEHEDAVRNYAAAWGRTERGQKAEALAESGRALARELEDAALAGSDTAPTALFQLADFELRRPGVAVETWRPLTEACIRVAARSDRDDLGVEIARTAAELCLEAGDTEGAQQVLETALAQLLRSRRRPELSFYLGEVLRMRWKWSEALDVLRRAELELGPPVAGEGDAYGNAMRARIYGTQAQVHHELGLMVEAARYLEREGELALAGPYLQGRLVHFLHSVEQRTTASDYEGALELLDRRAHFVGDEELDPDSELALSLYRALAEADLARERGEVDEDALSTLLDLAAPPDAADRALDAPSLEAAERAVAARRYIEQLVALGRLDEAQAELARHRSIITRLERPDAEAGAGEAALWAALEVRLALARAPRDEKAVLELRAAHGRLEAAFGAYLEVWGAIDRPPGGIGFLALPERRGVLSTLVDSYLRLDGPEAGVRAALHTWMRAQALGSLAQAEGLEVPTLAEVRAKLLQSDDHGLLMLLPGGEDVRVLVLDQGGLDCSVVGGQSSLRARCRELGRAIERHLGPRGRRGDGRSGARKVEALGRAIWNDLIDADVEERVAAWSSMTIVGTELLELYYPEALVTSGADGALVGERWAVDVLTSVPVGIARSSQPPGASELECLFVGTLEPVVTERTGSLWRHELRRDEIEPLLEAYGEHRAILGRKATSAAFVEALEARPRVVHVLAHGIYDSHTVRGATLALASAGEDDNGLFGAGAVERTSFAGLVVLSACGSARGPRRPGDDEQAHLGGAFLAAGARAVVLSRTKIEFATTLRLMRAFHAQLRGGSSPAEALRRARIESAPREDPWARWYAAGMQVFGAGQRPLFE